MSIEVDFTAVDPSLIEQIEADFAEGRGLTALRDARHCHLHKAWHAIHFLLTGLADEAPLPEGYLLDGGRELDQPAPDDELDIPPRLLTPEEFEEFATVLDAMDPQELRRRFDHAAMREADIYSIGPHEEEEFEFVQQFLDELRMFAADAVKAGQGALITMG